MESIVSPAQALLAHADKIAETRDRITALYRAVNSPEALTLSQWAQLEAFALAFAPDLIVELGRGGGNSTCCFLEAAHHLRAQGRRCRVLSLCLSEQ